MIVRSIKVHKQARIQDFKLGGALNKIAKIVGVFRVKNHGFAQKKIIFFPILGERALKCDLKKI